jgi:hypothetical protein
VLRGTIATLAALAKHTGRILVLPRVIVDYHAYFAWTHLDLQSLEKQGVEFRETSFANNPKAWLGDPATTTTTTTGGASASADGTFDKFGKFGPDGEPMAFASVARTAMYWKDAAWQRNSYDKALLYAQVDGGGGTAPGGSKLGGPVRAWKVSERAAVDAFFAIHTAIPELRDAEALFVNPYFVKVRACVRACGTS